MLASKDLLALRGAVDEGLHLIAILDQDLPAVRARSPWDDPDLFREAIEAGVNPYDYIRTDKPKTAAPARRQPQTAERVSIKPWSQPATPNTGPRQG